MNLAAGLKINSDLQQASIAEAEPYFDKWFDGSDKSAMEDFEREHAWDAFEHFWRIVRYPMGDDLVKIAYHASMMINEPKCAERYRAKSPKMFRLVCALAVMQAIVGDKPFTASVRQIGKWWSFSHMTANRSLKILEKHKIIKCVSRVKPSKHERIANSYRFIGAV